MPNFSLLLASVLLLTALSDDECDGEERPNSNAGGDLAALPPVSSISPSIWRFSGDEGLASEWRFEGLATPAALPPGSSPSEWRFEGLMTASARPPSSSRSPSEWGFLNSSGDLAALPPVLHFDVDQVERLCSGDRPWDRCVDYFERESDRVLQSELGRHLACLQASMAQVAEQLAGSVDILSELIMLNFDWLRLDLAIAFNQRCSLLCTAIVIEADAIMSKYVNSLRRDVMSSLRLTLDAITGMVMAEFQDQMEFESQPIRELYDNITAQSEKLVSEPKVSESLIDIDLGSDYSVPISTCVQSTIVQESIYNDEEFALAKEPQCSITTDGIESGIFQVSIGDVEELNSKEPGSDLSSQRTETESSVVQESIGDVEELSLAQEPGSALSTTTKESVERAIAQESVDDLTLAIGSLPESFDYSASAENGLLSWLNDVSSSLPETSMAHFQLPSRSSLPFQPWQPSDGYTQLRNFDFSGYLQVDQTVLHNALVDFFQAEWRRILKSELDDRFTPAFKQHFKQIEDELVTNLALIADAPHQNRLEQVFLMTVTVDALCVSLAEGWWAHHSNLCLVLLHQAYKIASEQNADLSLVVMGQLSFKLHEVMRDLEADLRLRANEAKSKALLNIWTRLHEQRSLVPQPTVAVPARPASVIKKPRRPKPARRPKPVQTARLVKEVALNSSHAPPSPEMESDRDGDITPEKDSLQENAPEKDSLQENAPEKDYLQENAPAGPNSEIQSGLAVEQLLQDLDSSSQRNADHISNRDLNSKASTSSRQRTRSDSGTSSSRPAMFLFHVKRHQAKMKSVKPEWRSHNSAASGSTGSSTLTSSTPALEPNNSVLIDSDSGAPVSKKIDHESGFHNDPKKTDHESGFHNDSGAGASPTTKKADQESSLQLAQSSKENGPNDLALNLSQAAARAASIHGDITVNRTRSRRPTILDKIMPPIEFNNAPMVEDPIVWLYQYECRVFEQCVHNAMAAASSRYTLKLAEIDRAQPSQLFLTLLGHEPKRPVSAIKKYVVALMGSVRPHEPTKDFCPTTWTKIDPFSSNRQTMTSLKYLVCNFFRFEEADLYAALEAMRDDVSLHSAQYDTAQVMLAFRSLYEFYRDLHQSRITFVKRIVTDVAVQAMQMAFEQLAMVRQSFHRNIVQQTVSRLPRDIAAMFAELQDSTRRLELVLDKFIIPVQEILSNAERDLNLPQIDLDPGKYVQRVDSELARSLLDLPQRWRIKQKLNSISCQLEKISTQLAKEAVAKKKDLDADSVAERLISEAKPLLSDALKKFRKEAFSQPLLIKESEGHPLVQHTRQAKLRSVQKAVMFNADLLIQCRVRMQIEQSLEQAMARAKQLPADGVMARPVFRWFDDAIKSFYNEGIIIDGDKEPKTDECSSSEERRCMFVSDPESSTKSKHILMSTLKTTAKIFVSVFCGVLLTRIGLLYLYRYF